MQQPQFCRCTCQSDIYREDVDAVFSPMYRATRDHAIVFRGGNINPDASPIIGEIMTKRDVIEGADR